MAWVQSLAQEFSQAMDIAEREREKDGKREREGEGHHGSFNFLAA